METWIINGKRVLISGYVVEEYEADGCCSPPETLHRSEHDTLRSARARVRRLLDVRRLSSARRWGGGDEAVEAYHMYPLSHHKAWGCGGYQIVATFDRSAAARAAEEAAAARADSDVLC